MCCRSTDTAGLYPEGKRHKNSRRTVSCPSPKGWQKILGNFFERLYIYDKNSLNWILIILNMFCAQTFWQALVISKDWLLDFQLFFDILHLRIKFNMETMGRQLSIDIIYLFSHCPVPFKNSCWKYFVILCGINRNHRFNSSNVIYLPIRMEFIVNIYIDNMRVFYILL